MNDGCGADRRWPDDVETRAAVGSVDEAGMNGMVVEFGQRVEGVGSAEELGDIEFARL